jgi:DNA-binding Lrp family transcriptional regulator
MSVTPRQSAALNAPPALALSLARASAELVIDITQISRAGGDLLQPLLLTAILEANQALINQDPALQRVYGDLETSAPDELRRPVSVNAVAESLSLPFETVRRRVRALARQGLCVVTPRGVYVPNAAVTSAGYNAIQRGRYERLKAFHDTAVRLGVVGAPSAVSPPRAAPPIRAADRALAEYMLRVSDRLMALTGGVIDGVVFLELARSNLAPLSEQDLARPDLSERLAPIRTLPLARRRGLPRETTRRHVFELEARGFCKRDSRGLRASAPPAAWPKIRALLTENLANVQRLFARLNQLGVPAHWLRDDR